MPELTASTREAARRLGVSDTAIHKAERAGRIAREPNGQWDIDKTRRRLTETADPVRSPLANGAGAEGTPFARLKIAQLPPEVEAMLPVPSTARRPRHVPAEAQRQHGDISRLRPPRGSRIPAPIPPPRPEQPRLRTAGQARRNAVG